MNEIVETLRKYSNGTWLKVIFGKEDVVLEGVIDTVYETCNEFDETNDHYREYYACAFMITQVIKNTSIMKYQNGMLIELSEYNIPTKIELSDESVIWEKSNVKSVDRRC